MEKLKEGPKKKQLRTKQIVYTLHSWKKINQKLEEKNNNRSERTKKKNTKGEREKDRESIKIRKEENKIGWDSVSKGEGVQLYRGTSRPSLMCGVTPPPKKKTLPRSPGGHKTKTKTSQKVSPRCQVLLIMWGGGRWKLKLQENRRATARGRVISQAQRTGSGKFQILGATSQSSSPLYFTR
jgi:hypothetical protein